MRLIIVLFLLISFHGSTQYRGYYGKKNIVELNAGIRYSIFNLLLGPNYGETYLKKKGGRLHNGRNNLDYAFRFNYSHAAAGSFGFGVEYSMELGNIACPTDETNSGFTYYENLRMQSHVFIPKIEVASKSSLLPIGLSHHIGVGFGLTKIAERDYSYGETTFSNSVPFGGSIPIVGTRNDHVNYDLSIRSLKLLYEMHMRTPITKWVTLNYGFRYNLNVPISSSVGSATGPDQVSSSEILSRMRYQRWRSLITFNLGIGYIF